MIKINYRLATRQDAVLTKGLLERCFKRDNL